MVLLSHLVSFFQAALDGGFKEAQEETITMPEEEPKVIRRFQVSAFSSIHSPFNYLHQSVKPLADEYWADRRFFPVYRCMISC